MVVVPLVAFNPASPSSFEGIEEQQPMILNFIQMVKKRKKNGKKIWEKRKEEKSKSRVCVILSAYIYKCVLFVSRE